MYSSKNTILSKFLMSYIIFVFVPVIMGAVIYFKTVTMVEEDVKEANVSMMTHNMKMIDKHLQEIDSIIKRLALNPRILTFINMKKLEEGSPEIYKVIDAMEDLSAYRFVNSLIKEVYVYSNENSIIMSTSNAQTRMYLAYGSYFKFEDLNYDEWNEKLKTFYSNCFMPSASVLINGNEYSIITNIQSLPIEAPIYNKGAVMVLIDANAVNQILNQVNIGDSGWAYIEGKNGEIITSISNNDKIIEPIEINSEKQSGIFKCRVDDKDMIATYVKSSFNDWNYVALLPANFIMAKVNYIKTIIIMAVLICFFIGVVLSFTLSYKNSKPIKDISDMLEGLFGHSSECKNQYVYLKGSITKLINSNCDLQSKLNGQMPILRAAIFMRLLRGGVSDIDEINTNFNRLGIVLSGLRYSVMIIKIKGYGNLINKNILKELDVARLIINGMIIKKFGENTVTCDLDEKCIAILLSFKIIDQEKIHDNVEKLANEIQNDLLVNHNIRVSFSIGGIYKSITDTVHSFSDAQQVMGSRFAEADNKLVWYSQNDEKVCSYSYTIETETTLMNLVKSGDTEKVGSIFKSVYKDNFINRHLPPHIANQLICQIKGTVLRLAEAMPDFQYSEHILNDNSESDKLDDVFDFICNECIKMCEHISRKKEDSNEVLKKEILNYMETVYMNEELTIYSVASHFSVTESYLYHFFKDNMGASFADYIEKLRIEHANRLLLETDLPVKDIAAKVGYNSPHSFRRAFKRCKGVIPSEIRVS